MADDAAQAAVERAAALIRGAAGDHPPRLAVILGSGLGGIARAVTAPQALPYASLPGFPVSGVAGHENRHLPLRVDAQDFRVPRVVSAHGVVRHHDDVEIEPLRQPGLELVQLFLQTCANGCKVRLSERMND